MREVKGHGIRGGGDRGSPPGAPALDTCTLKIIGQDVGALVDLVFGMGKGCCGEGRGRCVWVRSVADGMDGGLGRAQGVGMRRYRAETCGTSVSCGAATTNGRHEAHVRHTTRVVIDGCKVVDAQAQAQPRDRVRLGAHVEIQVVVGRGP